MKILFTGSLFLLVFPLFVMEEQLDLQEVQSSLLAMQNQIEGVENRINMLESDCQSFAQGYFARMSRLRRSFKVSNRVNRSRIQRSLCMATFGTLLAGYALFTSMDIYFKLKTLKKEFDP